MKVPHNTSLMSVEKILNGGAADFGVAALELFRYQHTSNSFYRQYCDMLHIDPAAVTSVTNIPYLPITFFKSQIVLTAPATANTAAIIFESSGTTGEIPSRHYVHDKQVYEQSLLAGFREFYGDPADYTILALLPSYLERSNASLVYMARTLMEVSKAAENGFYINEWEQLHNSLLALVAAGRKTLLLGVTFALLDFAEAFPMQLSHTIVMETGGMKGRKAEMTRDEVHDLLKKQFGLPAIHSEYGMTELLSQAYSTGEGVFKSTGTMQVLVRDINDPLDVFTTGSGAINVIDLANIHSCAFIATEDMGIIAADGTFRVLGRMDHSALRGCSLMSV